jgi:hypothetical protein
MNDKLTLVHLNGKVKYSSLPHEYTVLFELANFIHFLCTVKLRNYLSCIENVLPNLNFDELWEKRSLDREIVLKLA